MYAPFTVAANHDAGRLFLETCTSTPATAHHLRMVNVAATLLHVALDDETDTRLAEFCANAGKWTESLPDILATASHVVIDRVIESEASVATLERCMSRVSDIARAALPIEMHDAKDVQRTAHAIV